MGWGFCRRKYASGFELFGTVSMADFHVSNFERNRSKLEPFTSNLETLISNVERWAVAGTSRAEI